MGNLFSDKYDDHFYSSKKDEEEQKKKNSNLWRKLQRNARSVN